MPIFYNDRTDDPLVFDSQPLITGVNTYGRSSTLAATIASKLENVELGVNGITRSRRGCHRIDATTYTTIHAIITLRISTWDYGIMIFADGHIYLHSVTASGKLIDNAHIVGNYDPNADPKNCSVTEIAGVVYFSDGSGDILAVRKLGDEGILVDADGNSIWDDVSSLISYDIAVEIADPDSPENTRALTAHRFRLFCATGIDTLHVSQILPEIGGTTPDDASDDDPADSGSDAFDTTSGDNAFDSSALASIRIGKGDSDAIRALVPFTDFRLAVLKENSIYVVDANPAVTNPANFTVQLVSDKVGCLAEKSAVRVGDDIMFLSRDGVRTLGRAFQQDQMATSDPISLPIHDVIESINWGSATKACATFWRGRYILAVPTGSSTENNTVLVYNTEVKQWAGVWTGLKPTQFDVWEPLNDRRSLVFADKTNNNIVQLRDHIEEDATVPDDYADDLDGTKTTVPFEILTRAMSFNDPVSPKTCDHMEVEFFKSKARVNITLVPDGGDEVILDSGNLVDTGTGDLTLDFVLPDVLGRPGVVRHNMSLLGNNQGREFQVRIVNSSDNQITEAGLTLGDQRYIALRNVNLGAFVETMESQL